MGHWDFYGRRAKPRQISGASQRTARRSMDSAYLKTSVGDVLAHALAFVAAQQPDDPIECLAHYLKKHAANKSAQHHVWPAVKCSQWHTGIFA